MKIVDTCADVPAKKQTLPDITGGTAFLSPASSNCYIKLLMVTHTGYNVVNIATGELIIFSNNDTIIPLPNAKFVKGL